MKTWIYRYRTPDGRPPRFTIGSPPGIGLKDARDRAAGLDREVALGADPATERREARVEVKVAPTTFNDPAMVHTGLTKTDHDIDVDERMNIPQA